MSEPTFPDPEAAVESTDPAALHEAIGTDTAVAILDVRTPSDYETWRIEGANLTSVNVPYYRFLEGDVQELVETVPGGEELVVVCAKGEASEYVGGLLNDEGFEATNLANGMEGWARVYEHVDVELDSGASVRQYHRPSSGCLAYMIFDDGEAAVVDPLRAFTDQYVADAADLGLDITTVIETHVHADHVSGARDLAAAADADLVLPERAVARGVDYDVAFETVTDGDRLPVGDTHVEAIAAPGHTTGMTAYLVDGLVLTGDTLLIDNVARPDLEEGAEGAPEAAAQLHETLHERILTLPEETLVGAAHVGIGTPPRDDGAYLATLSDVTDSLAVLSADEETFVERILSNMPPRPANFEQIIAINLGQEATDAEEAFELELGPSNCAASE